MYRVSASCPVLAGSLGAAHPGAVRLRCARLARSLTPSLVGVGPMPARTAANPGSSPAMPPASNSVDGIKGDHFMSADDWGSCEQHV